MEFQRYYDGVGLIVQNKINNAFASCPLCATSGVEYEIVFDFKGELICVLAKCPHCGGIIKTIFNFNRGENPSSFTVSELGDDNHNNLLQGVNYQLPSKTTRSSVASVSTEQKSSDKDSGSAGWGVLGFFFPLVGFILWLVWKDEHPARSKSAGIGCLVSICLDIVGVILYFAIIIGIAGIGAGIDAIQAAVPLLV